MNTTRRTAPPPLAALLLGAVALVYLGNGALMLTDPAGWYARVPGVTETGPMNPHFIRDIGFAFVLSGAAFVAALAAGNARPRERARWAALGTAWPALHAAFHLVEWGTHGLPRADALLAELLAVVLPVAIGLAFALQGLHSAAPVAGEVPGA